MQILHAVPSLQPAAGGPARSVSQLALAQARLGCNVTVWVKDGRHLCFPDGIDPESQVAVVAGNISRTLTGPGCFDVVHDHGLWQPYHHRLASLCQQLAIPRVVSIRGMLEPWAMNHKRWKKRVAWWLYQRRDLNTAQLLHATAQSEAQQLKALGLLPPVTCIPNGVVLPFLDSVSTTGRTCSEPHTALFVGRLHPKKGLPMLIEAWHRHNPEGWRMRVVGPDEGGHLSELKRLVAKYGLESSWQFDGSLEGDAKWQTYQSADLVILPTYSENFGITVAEALACGTPVITTTGAPWQGLVEHGCGWWVEPTVDALAEAMRDAMVNTPEDTLVRKGASGRDWVKTAFSWPSIAEEMIKGYQSVLKKNVT